MTTLNVCCHRSPHHLLVASTCSFLLRSGSVGVSTAASATNEPPPIAAIVAPSTDEKSASEALTGFNAAAPVADWRDYSQIGEEVDEDDDDEDSEAEQAMASKYPFSLRPAI
ncbi:hypothetical protein SAY86_026936 [Trapa natans]|uniref:Uncharacterized protein n=1 Tax=Trapa natans TaxID=22666 RepID=A0AAN7KSN4_TRANT|nr:hypothetical protein SAY86_026936 [Trapa natans]